MSVPVAALTGGAGGSELDAPGTIPPPQSVTAPLDDTAGGGGGVAGDQGRPSGGSAPIPFPGEEDVEDERVGSGSEALGGEDGEEDAPEGSASARFSRGGGAAATRGGSGRGRGRGRGGWKGGNNVAQAKAARAVTAGKKAANLPGTSQLPTARVKKIIMVSRPTEKQSI
jgi:hypothetical protein